MHDQRNDLDYKNSIKSFVHIINTITQQVQSQ